MDGSLESEVERGEIRKGSPEDLELLCKEWQQHVAQAYSPAHQTALAYLELSTLKPSLSSDFE